MNDTITYEWTEELAKASLQAFYKVKIGRNGLIDVGGFILLVFGFCDYFFINKPIGIVLCFIGFILFISPLRIYLCSWSLAKDTTKLIDDPEITLTITNDSITVSSQKASRIIQWGRISKLKEVDEFLIFFTGKLLTLSIPKEPLSNEQFGFIRSKIVER